MTVFEKASPENTRRALEIAIDKAMALDCDIVFSTQERATAFVALEVAGEKGFTGKIFAFTTGRGMENPDENAMTEETRRELEAAGIVLAVYTNAFSGVKGDYSGRLSGKSGSHYPAEVVTHALLMFGQGVRVCVEIAAMAVDAKKLPFGKPAVALGGDGYGLDTVCVLTAGYSISLFHTRIHEVLCKPW